MKKRMQTNIETKGFRPGTALNRFLSEQLQSLHQHDKELVWTEFKLTFEDNNFHSDLCLIFDDSQLNIAAYNKNFYEAVLNTIDFARELLNMKENISSIKRKVTPLQYVLPGNTFFQFSSN